MEQQKKTYYKNFLTMLSGNSISQLIPFVMAPIIFRHFEPDEFAVFNNFLAIATMFGIVAAGRLELAIPLSKSHTGAQNIAFTGLAVAMLLTLISLSVIFFRSEIGEMYHSKELSDYLWYVPPAVLSIGLLGLTNYWILRKGKFPLLSIGRVSQSLINGGVTALLGYLGWGINGLVWGWLLSQFVGIAIMLLFSDLTFKRRNYDIITVKSTLKEYKDFPLINSLHAFTDIFATQFLLFWIITVGFGLPQLGLFTMMHKYVRAPIVLITNSVSQVFYKEASDAINQNKDVTPVFFRTILTSGAFSVPFLLVLFLFGRELFTLYIGSDWTDAGTYAKCIIPMLFMLFLNSPVSGIPLLYNKQRTAYLIAALGYTFSLTSLFLCVLAGWSFSASLVVYSIAYSCMNIANLVWYYSLVRKHRLSLTDPY